MSKGIVENLYGKKYCPACGKAADFEFDEKEKKYKCSRCHDFIVTEIDKLQICRPVMSDEQRDCDHIFFDVTVKRRKLIENRELPEWVKILIGKNDPKWRDRSEKWKSLKYTKCSNCGILEVIN